jgi:hypothetical protein
MSKMRIPLLLLAVFLGNLSTYAQWQPLDSTERKSFRYIRLHGGATFKPFGIEGFDLVDNGTPYEMGLEMNVYHRFGIYSSLAVHPMALIYDKENGAVPLLLFGETYMNIHARYVGYQLGITYNYSLLNWLDYNTHLGIGKTRMETQTTLMDLGDLTSDILLTDERLWNYSLGFSLHARLPNNLGIRLTAQLSKNYPVFGAGISYYIPTKTL